MIGILGGTFDPVHFGHLRPALEIRQALGLDEVRLIPCHIPPHRPQPVANPEQRTAMLQAAIENYPDFVIDEREFGHGGPSYTLDTLVSLRQEVVGKTLCLLLGMDAFRGLTAWHRWRELLNYCHMVVMTRPRAELPEQGELADFVRLHRAQDVAMLQSQAGGLLWFQAVTQLEISATEVRRLLATGEPADFLLPASVLDYINREGLYRA
jgi:nicotinate-nucleotide adenylyltransferase